MESEMWASTLKGYHPYAKLVVPGDDPLVMGPPTVMLGASLLGAYANHCLYPLSALTVT